MSFLTARSLSLFTHAVPSTAYIYSQQYQMGLFLSKYYQGSAVALNDIGAVNYLAEIRCWDVWGLASVDVARELRAGGLDAQRLSEMARHKDVKIAVGYSSDIEGPMPDRWAKVGEWQVLGTNVLGADTITLYAVDPAEEARLIASLRDFAPNLPANVRQSGEYTR